MTTITEATARTTATPESLFIRWADMATWPEWNADTEWVRLDGPFATGSRGVLKPKGGPKVKFVIKELAPGRRFVDVSLLLGARLTFDHVVTPREGGCDVQVTVTINGPLAFAWKRILGGGFRKTVQPDLDQLVALVEAS
ncbi:MAG TPA: SRPBCC family protein [Acidothermaceae bacterium]|jgi:hypothetical protein